VEVTQPPAFIPFTVAQFREAQARLSHVLATTEILDATLPADTDVIEVFMPATDGSLPGPRGTAP
jgi:hypothetical protein